MKHLIAPNQWSCMPTALAMVLDCSVEQVIEAVGHDGSEIIRPALREPLCRRAFHLIDLQLAAYQMGYDLILIENNPYTIRDEELIYLPDEPYTSFLMTCMERYRGVVTGILNEKPHALAWDREKLLCTSGLIYPLGKMKELDYFMYVAAHPAAHEQRNDVDSKQHLSLIPHD
jgi:hypothetical protein